MKPSHPWCCFLYDSARPHTLRQRKALLQSYGWDVLLHSLDLAPGDFFLFSQSKLFLDRKHFSLDGEQKEMSLEWFQSQADIFYETGILTVQDGTKSASIEKGILLRNSFKMYPNILGELNHFPHCFFHNNACYLTFWTPLVFKCREHSPVILLPLNLSQGESEKCQNAHSILLISAYAI